MQYNLTPLLNVEQMQPQPATRCGGCASDGITDRSAMQDDVNGISWLYADLLPAIGVEILTLRASIQIRGRAPKPFPGGVLVGGPGGRQAAGLERLPLPVRPQRRQARRSALRRARPRRAGSRASTPIPTIRSTSSTCESTHPMRVDNGPPEPRMPEFVRPSGTRRAGRRASCSPRLRVRRSPAHRTSCTTWRGDWTDWWSDGAGIERLRDRPQPRDARDHGRGRGDLRPGRGARRAPTAGAARPADLRAT